MTQAGFLGAPPLSVCARRSKRPRRSAPPPPPEEQEQNDTCEAGVVHTSVTLARPRTSRQRGLE